MVRVDGHTGALRVGYQLAADLGSWHLELLPELPRRYRLVAVVRATSAYWLAQRPLDVALDVASKRWLWRDITPVIDGAQVTIVAHGVPAILGGLPVPEAHMV